MKKILLDNSIPLNYNEDEDILEIKKIEFDEFIKHKFVLKKSVEKVKKSIEKYKKELQKTDYIIIKMYESKLLLTDSPYDNQFLEKIVIERQSIRDKINKLELLLK